MLRLCKVGGPEDKGEKSGNKKCKNSKRLPQVNPDPRILTLLATVLQRSQVNIDKNRTNKITNKQEMTAALLLVDYKARERENVWTLI